MGSKLQTLETAKANFRNLLGLALAAIDSELTRREELRTSLLNGDGEEGLSGAVQGAGLADVLITDCIGLLPALSDLAMSAGEEVEEEAQAAERQASERYSEVQAEWAKSEADEKALRLPKEAWDAAKQNLSAAQLERRKLQEWGAGVRFPEIRGLPWADFMLALKGGDLDGDDLGRITLLQALRPYRQQLQDRLRYLDLGTETEAITVTVRLLPSGPVGIITYSKRDMVTLGVGGTTSSTESWKYGLLGDAVDVELLEWLKRENLPRRKTAARRT